jgi:hypothetical protein
MSRPMPAMTRRYWTQQLGLPRHTKAPTRIWRSTDLRGPLPRETVRELLSAIPALPRQSPWPNVDEGWCQAVLTDRRLRREGADQRLDQLPVKSLTFECKWCGRHTTVKVDDLIGMFGRDRSVESIRRHVLECRDKRSRREGEECPITYQA